MDEQPIFKICCEKGITLWGTYKIFYDMIVSSWGWDAESTRRQYEAIIRNVIAAYIPDHDDRAIFEYTPDLIDHILERIVLDRRIQAKEPLEESTIQKYRHIFNVLLETAERNHLCAPVRTKKGLSIEGERKKNVSKYFTPFEEIRINDSLEDKLLTSGEARALWLIFVTRMRENEACGLTWGSLMETEFDPRYFQVVIAQSTNLRKATLKPSGKTRNAPRILVLSLKASEMIRKVKEALYTRWIESGEDPERFNAMRIACRGDDLHSACYSRNLTDYANKMFREIGIREHVIADAAQELIREKVCSIENPDAYGNEFEEQSATAYTLRRDAASHDRILGYSTQERKYAMGHQGVGTTQEIYTFTDAQKLQELAHKMDRRAIVGGVQTQKVELLPGQNTQIKNEHTSEISVKGKCKLVKVRIEACEPGDVVKVKLIAEPGKCYRVESLTYEKDLPNMRQQPINARKYYYRCFAEKEEENK